jgi:hypothetical protein
MVKLNYSKLTDEQLAKKEKENKGLVLVSVVTFLSLIYYFLREYFVENRINIFLAGVLILTVVGTVQVYLRVKGVREERNKRRNLS